MRRQRGPLAAEAGRRVAPPHPTAGSKLCLDARLQAGPPLGRAGPQGPTPHTAQDSEPLLGVPWSPGLCSRRPPAAPGASPGGRALSPDPQKKAETEVTPGPEERQGTALLFGLPAPNSEPRSPAVERVPVGHSSTVTVMVVVVIVTGHGTPSPPPSRPPEAAAPLHVAEQLLHLLTGALGRERSLPEPLPPAVGRRAQGRSP